MNLVKKHIVPMVLGLLFVAASGCGDEDDELTLDTQQIDIGGTGADDDTGSASNSGSDTGTGNLSTDDSDTGSSSGNKDDTETNTGAIDTATGANPTDTETGTGADTGTVIEPGCGDGRQDYGEECDDGETDTGDGCSHECKREVCGNGRVDPGEECDDECAVPPDDGDCCNGKVSDGNGGWVCKNTSNWPCDSQCRIVECGNGRVEGEEQCDDAIDYSGDPKHMSEQCINCSWVGECDLCEQDHCELYNEVPVMSNCRNLEGTAVSGPAAGTARSELCVAFVDCVHDSGCAYWDPKSDDNAGNDEEGLYVTLRCYCGAGVDPITCMANGGEGACKSEAEAAAETTDAVEIAEVWGDPHNGLAIGQATTWLLCDEQYCQTCLQPPK